MSDKIVDELVEDMNTKVEDSTTVVDNVGNDTFENTTATTTEGGSAQGDNIVLTNPGADIEINLGSGVDIISGSEESKKLLLQIQAAAESIKCENVHHMGTAGDYLGLIKKYKEFIDVNGDINVDLNIDISALTKFADECVLNAEMFESITLKYKNLQTVDDSAVLKATLVELLKIERFVKSIKNFKAQIVGTSVLQIPDTVIKTKEQLNYVLQETECISEFIAHFTTYQPFKDEEHLAAAELSAEDKEALIRAEAAISSWIDLVKNGASVTMAKDKAILAFKELIAKFDDQTKLLKASRAKFAELLAPFKR